MKRTVIYGLLVVLVAGISAPALGSGVGFAVGFEPSGLWILGALTELSITEVFDVRVQLGYAAPMLDVEGLMLAGITAVPHWPMPPIDPFAGVGIGVALTPPGSDDGIFFEGAAGIRLIPADVIIVMLQTRYLIRWTTAGWSAGPVFEGGILMRF